MVVDSPMPMAFPEVQTKIAAKDWVVSIPQSFHFLCLWDTPDDDLIFGVHDAWHGMAWHGIL
jgi:hypothetical protein